MRTIDSTENDLDEASPADRIVAGVHDMIAGFRCAGTGRLVRSGVSMTHLHVMWLLEHHGAMPMNRVAELLDVSFSNATGIVDRMAERGLVERVRVPDDRRLVLVRITPKGIEALEETEALKQNRLQSILAHLDDEQVSRLAAAIDDLRGAIAAEFGPDYATQGHVHDHDHDRSHGRD